MEDLLLYDALENSEISKKNDTTYYFHIKENNAIYLLEFEKFQKSNSIIIQFYLIDKNGLKYTISNTGHTKKVYSTMLKLFLEYVKNYNPDEFVFNSDDRHYKFNKFYSKVILHLFPDYTLEEIPQFNMFLFSRKDISRGSIKEFIDKNGNAILSFMMPLMDN